MTLTVFASTEKQTCVCVCLQSTTCHMHTVCMPSSHIIQAHTTLLTVEQNGGLCVVNVQPHVAFKLNSTDIWWTVLKQHVKTHSLKRSQNQGVFSLAYNDQMVPLGARPTGLQVIVIIVCAFLYFRYNANVTYKYVPLKYNTLIFILCVCLQMQNINTNCHNSYFISDLSLLKFQSNSSSCQKVFKLFVSQFLHMGQSVAHICTLTIHPTCEMFGHRDTRCGTKS